MDAAYLEKNVNAVLSEGLAAVVLQKPQDPVDFLGKFLLNYVSNEELKAKVAAEQVERSQKVSAYLESERQKQIEREKQLAAKILEQKDFEAFLFQLANAHSTQSVSQVMEIALSGLQRFVSASSAYVAQLIDENHLKYVSATPENSFLVDEVIERANGGATFDLFEIKDEDAPAEEEEEDDPDDDSEEAVARRKQRAEEKARKAAELKTVHVKDVLIGPGSEKVHFFRQPQLGAFFSVRIQYSSALHEEAVQKAAERDGPKVEVKEEVEEPEEEVKPKKGKKPAKKVEEDEEEDQSEEKEDEDDEEAKERKAAAAKKAEEEAAKQREWASLSEEERAIRKEKEEMARLMLDIPMVPKQYAISLDTLTQNRPFTDDQIERIKAVARLVQSELESVDRQLFKQEVQRRIQLNLCVNHPFKKKEETKMRKDLGAKLGKDVASPDVQFAFRKAVVLSVKDIIMSWRNHLVFRGPLNVVEAVFYLLGYTQAELVDKSNQITWKTLSEKFDETFAARLENYEARAEEVAESGDGAVKYQLINQRIEEQNAEEIKSQNFPLSELLGLITDALAVKQIAKEERLAAEEVERQQREEEEERRKEEEERNKAEAGNDEHEENAEEEDE